MQKRSVYLDLLNVFRDSQNKSPDLLVREINSCDIPSLLKKSLQEAINGDNRPLNNWLFSSGLEIRQCIAWIAPIKSETPKYVWMIGWQNETSILVHELSHKARVLTKKDPFILQSIYTPNLLFVDTEEVSTVSVGGLNYEDEFAIFQVGYKDTPVEVFDVDQRMVINTSFAVQKRKAAFKRFKSVCLVIDEDIVTCLEENLELFAIVHNEYHNQGHFLGAWPFDENIKKKCVLYEAVEEFRACLASIALIEHLPWNDKTKDAYALSVFMTRFFGFGYEAFKLSNKRREIIREITVGLMFFEWLVNEEVITTDKSSKLWVNLKRIRFSLLNAYKTIFKQEAGLTNRNHSSLENLAKVWYRLAFPGGEYTNLAKNVYTSTRMQV